MCQVAFYRSLFGPWILFLISAIIYYVCCLDEFRSAGWSILLFLFQAYAEEYTEIESFGHWH